MEKEITMTEETKLHHIALEFEKKEQAEIFFTKILLLSQAKSYSLSKELSKSLFGLEKPIDVILYENKYVRFEVFFTPVQMKHGCTHACIEVQDKSSFIARCRTYQLEPFIIKKDGRELLFVRDFSSNLYEVKEQQKI